MPMATPTSRAAAARRRPTSCSWTRQRAGGAPIPGSLARGAPPVPVHRPGAPPALLLPVAAHGFAAALLLHHLALLRDSPGVLQVVPDTVFQLHTTRTPEFLGLLSPAYQPAIRNLDAASHDVVIGVLDTGVWPESPSFAGGDLPPPPAHWKGVCEAGVDFPASACGRKLVGARSFSRGFRAANGGRGGMGVGRRSARDRDGHGTHTATTAAGAAVANASLFGYATGTARGMAPGARVAAYKVCWPEGCLGSDILAGIDSAVADGVGVLSLSLGNSGPSGATVANSAPWVTTVGAGTLDRDFPAYVTLTSGARLAGVSLYAQSGRPVMLPLVYGGSRDNASKLCLSGTLNPASVRGKIVLCDRGVNARVEKGAVVGLPAALDGAGEHGSERGGARGGQPPPPGRGGGEVDR
ncbi:hypothetical protein ZWY2020_049256 [Hordeum vulgare]|nr:hypothetical protein ZWY2020_049256 [Hordeum vulgare]